VKRGVVREGERRREDVFIDSYPLVLTKNSTLMNYTFRENSGKILARGGIVFLSKTSMQSIRILKCQELTLYAEI